LWPENTATGSSSDASLVCQENRSPQGNARSNLKFRLHTGLHQASPKFMKLILTNSIAMNRLD
jgi:hypothetical protein